MIGETVRGLLEQERVDVSRVTWAEPSDQPPAAPSHQWIAWPTADGELILGGMDRGKFAAYARFGDPTLAAEVLRRWIEPDLPSAPRDEQTLHSAALAVADELGATQAPTSQRSLSEVAPARVLPVGTPLDHVGNASGHVLYLYDTPMSARSLPPTDILENRMGFVLNATLPDACRVVRAEPWFGQPGGGLMVVLDRVIAYYVDRGVVSAFQLPAASPA